MGHRSLTLRIGVAVVLVAMVLVAPGTGRAGRGASSASVSGDEREFKGYVYAGRSPDASSPLADVVVTLYGSSDARVWGDRLDSVLTSTDGAYLLHAGELVYEYYHIVETDPPGFRSSDVQAGGGGVAVNLNWIRFPNPPPGLWPDNLFWDAAFPTSTPTATHQPHPTCTPSVTPTGEPEPGIDLQLLKEDDPDPVAPGESLTYTLTVINHGPSLARDVVVVDWLPVEVSYVSDTEDCSVTQVGAMQELRCELSDIPAGESVSFEVVVEVDAGARGPVWNSGKVWSEDDLLDRNPSNNTDYEETSVFPCQQPTVLVEMHRTEPACQLPQLDDVVGFSIEIVNAGPVPLLDVRLEDTFSGTLLEFLDASRDPTELRAGAAEGVLVWADLTAPWPAGFGHALHPGESFTLQVRFRAIQAGSYCNCAQALGIAEQGEDRDEACACGNIEDPRSVLQVNKSVDLPLGGVARVGEDVRFMVDLINVGEQPIGNLQLHDRYDPDYLSFSYTHYEPDDPADDGNLDWSDLTGPQPSGWGTPLNPGHAQGHAFSITFRAEAITPPGEPTLNCVWALFQHGDSPGQETAEMCAPVFIEGRAEAGVEVEKLLYVPSRGVAQPGDRVRFIFQVTNTGQTPITRVDLEDAYDTECLGFLSSGARDRDPSDWTDDGLLHWSDWLGLQTLEPGGSIQAIPGVQFQAKAGSNCDPTLNRVTAHAVDQYGQHVQDDDEEPVRIIVEEFPTRTPTATATRSLSYRVYLPVNPQAYPLLPNGPAR